MQRRSNGPIASWIDISTAVEDRRIVLTIKDQGIGLDLQLYGERLFGLFQRFHTHREGMGIGLYLVNSIVEAYGGKIGIWSEPGRGSTFTIYLSNACKKAKIVLLTSSSRMEDKEKALQYSNVLDYLEKPLTWKTAQKVIEDYFQ